MRTTRQFWITWKSCRRKKREGKVCCGRPPDPPQQRQNKNIVLRERHLTLRENGIRIMANQWTSGIHDRKLKELICEIGRRVYNKGFAAANDGNISIRVGENEVLCSPTMICKGFMTPDDICAVDMEGVQIAGKRKRTSEVLLHLAIMKNRADVKAVV